MPENTLSSLLRERLTHALSPIHLEIVDHSQEHAGHAPAIENKGYFTLVIVSSQFTGLNLVQRHRLVYTAVGDLMNNAIHALSIQAKAPDES